MQNYGLCFCCCLFFLLSFVRLVSFLCAIWPVGIGIHRLSYGSSLATRTRTRHLEYLTNLRFHSRMAPCARTHTHGQALLDRWALLFKVNSAIFLSRHGSRAFLNAVVGPAVPLIEGAFPQAYAYSIAAAFFCCSLFGCRMPCDVSMSLSSGASKALATTL